MAPDHGISSWLSHARRIRCECLRRSLMMSADPGCLENSPALEEPFEILLAVILEFDLAALASRSDDDARRKTPLEARRPFADLRALRHARTGVNATQPAPDECLGPPH